MTIPDLFKGLYSSNLHEVARMLSRATYITDYRVPEKTRMLHTGFTCKVQTGKVFEFLMDVKDWKSPINLVYQVKNADIHLPAIAGLMVSKEGGIYYRIFHLGVLSRCSLCSQSLNLSQQSLSDIRNNNLTHNVFTVFNIETNFIVAEYPNTYRHPHEFFLGSEEFLSAPPESAMDREPQNDYEENSNEFDQSNNLSDQEYEERFGFYEED